MIFQTTTSPPTTNSTSQPPTKTTYDGAEVGGYSAMVGFGTLFLILGLLLVVVTVIVKKKKDKLFPSFAGK